MAKEKAYLRTGYQSLPSAAVARGGVEFRWGGAEVSSDGIQLNVEATAGSTDVALSLPCDSVQAWTGGPAIAARQVSWQGSTAEQGLDAALRLGPSESVELQFQFSEEANSRLPHDDRLERLAFQPLIDGHEQGPSIEFGPHYW